MVLALLVALCIIIQSISCCPNGYHQHQDSCYAVLPIKTSFAKASTYCHAIGSKLAVVDTDAERQFLQQYINQKYGSKFGFYWIGGLNYIDGSWMWTDSLKNFLNINWAPGNPNSRPHQHCMMLVRHNNYLYADFECDQTADNAIICETHSSQDSIIG